MKKINDAGTKTDAVKKKKNVRKKRHERRKKRVPVGLKRLSTKFLTRSSRMTI